MTSLLLYQIAFTVLCVSLVLLWVNWISEIGVKRATLAIVFRALWILPFVLAFFPEETAQKIPKSVNAQPVHVFIDDSQSMQPGLKRDLGEFVPYVTSQCERLGCAVKVSKLSDFYPAQVSSGFSPLNEALARWSLEVGEDPWIVLSDGGDWLPTVPWRPELKDFGVEKSETLRKKLATAPPPRGLVVGATSEQRFNLFIESVDVAPVAFQDNPIRMIIRLSRSIVNEEMRLVQLQVSNGEKVLASQNAEFRVGELSFSQEITLPPLPRGPQLLTVKILPSALEKMLWDNEAQVPVTVMPNTVGVLHILGSPSFDGRFMRRFLKAEPKYELISFFILRDPWDTQNINERELSLIPFPVERLFTEELANFKLLVIQNFALFQFLQSEYQTNLVEFVKGGGGLLFIGGPRALQAGDLTSSALAEILPFEKPKDLPPSSASSRFSFGFAPLSDERSNDSKVGPYYDDELTFTPELANIDRSQKNVAALAYDWRQMGEELAKLGPMLGMHHTESLKLKGEGITPLLTAKTGEGKKMPLAVASYPGKGRAVWIFSDAFWQMAIDIESTTRQTYQKFMQSALMWLGRDEIKPALAIRSFGLWPDDLDAKDYAWRIHLSGQSLQGFDLQDWLVQVCQIGLEPGAVQFARLSEQDVELSGKIAQAFKGGEQCVAKVSANLAAHGQVEASMSATVPMLFRDEQIGFAPQRLATLTRFTQASYVVSSDDKYLDAVDKFLERSSVTAGDLLPDRYKSMLDHYWVLNRKWYWLLLVALLLEVLTRRWHLLVSERERKPRTRGKKLMSNV